jgi:hypothetical protein
MDKAVDGKQRSAMSNQQSAFSIQLIKDSAESQIVLGPVLIADC